MEKRLNDIVKIIEEELGCKYRKAEINGTTFFEIEEDGLVVHIDHISDGRVVVEYADNEKEAKAYNLEDGDSFWLDDYDDDEKIKVAVMDEIMKEVS